MDYRNLGRTGTKVSALCLGCMMFGDGADEADSIAMIDHALEAGVNFLDTANVYGRGKSEEIVGKTLKKGGRRANVVLATKVFGRMDDQDPNAQGSHRRHIVEQCEASLRRLQTDYIDLYQIHRPTSEIPIDETLRALDDLIRSGKVRYVGTSTFAAWQLMESLWVSKELGLNRFVSDQPPYHLLDRRIERELIPMTMTYGLAILPWSPLAGGLLTGKYQRGRERPVGSRFEREKGFWAARQFSGSAFDVVEVVSELAREKGCSSAQLSLAWCLHRPGVTSPIVGPRTLEQLRDNLGALRVEIRSEDHEKLDSASPPGGVVVPYYEADFGPHHYRW